MTVVETVRIRRFGPDEYALAIVMALGWTLSARARTEVKSDAANASELTPIRLMEAVMYAGTPDLDMGAGGGLGGDGLGGGGGAGLGGGRGAGDGGGGTRGGDGDGPGDGGGGGAGGTPPVTITVPLSDAM